MRNFVITAESVTAGHPDKLCDQISDAIVDAYLSNSDRTGVIAECAIATGVVFLSVRADVDAPVDPAVIARRVIADAGYDVASPATSPTVMLDLAPGGHHGHHDTAGPFAATHMVTAFGYACDQTPTDMPFPIWAAHRMSQALDAVRRDGKLGWLKPDAQVQLAVSFVDRRPVEIKAIAFQYGTAEQITSDHALEAFRRDVLPVAFDGAVPGISNATGVVALETKWSAGPLAHSGLTGRKAADDAYGSFIRRGGPALSGKDPSRIDRIAVYAARQAARCVVAAGLARECEVQLSYMAGDKRPVSVEVDTYGSGTMADEKISARLRETVDFHVAGIAERMGLWDISRARGGRFFRDLATYGHIGRDELRPPWEDTALADAIA